MFSARNLAAYISCAVVIGGQSNAVTGAPPDLKLTPPVKSAPGDLVQVKADTAAKTVKWKVCGDCQYTVDSTGRYINLVYRATRVDVFALAVNETGETSEFETLTFNALADPCKQDVMPGPGPGPTPPAPVTASKLFIVIVEETSDAAATRGAVFADAALSARMRDKGHVWRVVDKDVVGPDRLTPPEDVKRFLALAKGKALPQVYLVDDKGKTRYAGPTPATAVELLALLAQWGG